MGTKIQDGQGLMVRKNDLNNFTATRYRRVYDQPLQCELDIIAR